MDISSDEEDLFLFALAEDDDRERKRRRWVHKINEERETKGEFYTLMPKLLQDEERFYIYFRMRSESFYEILNLIQNDIRKENTNFRDPIPPGERLAITLRYLATGDSFSTIGHSFRVGFSTVSVIVKEVCAAIWNRMQPTYMAEPSSRTWESSALRFAEKWQFPNCIGSIDGKHITIKCPRNTGSKHFCYLKKFSVVLLAIVGADYEFICIDVGGYGKNSDGGIFEASAMGKRFESGTMKVPSAKKLPGQSHPTPHVIIGDEAFGLKPYLMRPFPQRQARGDAKKDKFNYRLCRARRVVENAFGILAQKWRIYHRPIEIDVKYVSLIVKTTCVLHNFLRCKTGEIEYNELLEPPKATGALITIENDCKRAAGMAFQVRENFMNYFE